MKLVRVVAPHFVAAFESDGIVRRTAPIIKYMLGWPDSRARSYIKAMGWKASIVWEKKDERRQCQADPGEVQGAGD